MSIGKIKEFDVGKDDWRSYIERIEQYFLVNNVSSELQVPTLITVMGSESYELLVNLCTPIKPKTLKLHEIIEVMERHLQPKPSPLAERYKFRNRKQREGECIAEYVAILKKMSKTCDFGSGLEESLRDQLACGISSETTRQRLFAEVKLTFGQAYTLAMSLEAAEKDAALVEGKTPETDTAVECKAISMKQRKTPTADGRGGRGERGSGWRERSGAGRPPRTTAEAARTQHQGCGACGGPHSTTSCRFARYVCSVCNEKGHLRRMCPNLTEQHSVNMMEEGDTLGSDEESDEVICIKFNPLDLTACKPIVVVLEVHGKKINMECDTGSAISCVSYEVYKNMFKDLSIEPCKVQLQYYTGEIIKPVGMIQPIVKYGKERRRLPLLIIRGGKTSLMGRQWMKTLKISLPIADSSVNCIKTNGEFNLTDFSSKYCEVFAEGLGRFTGGEVSIHVREGARPMFLRARPLAYAMRAPVERALEQLVRDGVLAPVERSDWATPIVPVVKKDGTIRICADYKLTLNKCLEVDRYPLPRVEELLVRLNGGERFSKIDLSQAYAQFVLDESKKYTVINTHKGLFVYNRLVYGLASSPGIFQRRLEQMFNDIPFVGVFLDDIIITGASSAQHMENLHKVFSRLKQYGLRVKREKCEFFSKSVTYLGHVISKEGIQTCPDKVRAILETPTPSNVSELRSFIGLIMYYAKFVKNISTVLAPLYSLLKSGAQYVFDEACEQAFEEVKRLLTSRKILMHYAPERPLLLTTDASSVGVGAVLSQLTTAGERPVAYASRSLSTTERAYSQLDREALAIIFGIRKFHQYFYGRNFTLRTDHKPLTHIFGNKVGIPIMAASRLQRWAVILAGYSYEIEYVASKKNCADALSRLPAAVSKREATKECTYVNFVEDFLPVSHDDVKRATERDTELSRVALYLQTGWPAENPSKDIAPYFSRRQELYCESGCIMWGYRMIIPRALRNLVLQQLHIGHMGIVKTKSLARSYVWWPGIDADVETLCQNCDTCAAEASAPPRAPPQPWPYATLPWTRVHIDFLGPFKGKTFLVLVDSTSKWIEIFEMPNTKATSVIKTLRTTFARFGLPEEVVSDQGPPFTSYDFKEFLKRNAIRQTFSPAYHPSSNGAAEGAVKICKRALKKAYRDRCDVDEALQAFLLAYRNTPHCTTGEPPAVLLQKRTLRSRLDVLRGTRALRDRVAGAQQRQVQQAGGTQRQFTQGETVWAQDYGGKDRWVKGTVADIEGSRRYVVDSGNGRLLKRHTDQMWRRSRLSDVPCPPPSPGKVIPPGEVPTPQGPRDSGRQDQVENDASATVGTPLTPKVASQPVAPPVKRIRKPVVRYVP